MSIAPEREEIYKYIKKKVFFSVKMSYLEMKIGKSSKLVFLWLCRRHVQMTTWRKMEQNFFLFGLVKVNRMLAGLSQWAKIRKKMQFIPFEFQG